MATQTPLTEERFLEALADIQLNINTRLDGFATKADLEQFATKEDLKQFATKEDLKGLATKQDLQDEIEGLRTEMQEMGASIVDALDTDYATKQQHAKLEKQVDDLISAL